MDLKTNSYEEDGEFVEMLNKLQITKFDTGPMKSPSITKHGLTAFTSSPCSPTYNNSSKYKEKQLTQKCLQGSIMKTLSISQDAGHGEQNIIVEEIDLNKTFSSKTMDHNQLSLMLAALESDYDDDMEN